MQARNHTTGELIDLAQFDSSLDLGRLSSHRVSRATLFAPLSVFFPCPPGRHLGGAIVSGGQRRRMIHLLDQNECLHGIAPYGEHGVVADSISDSTVSTLFDSRDLAGYQPGGHFTLRIDHQLHDSTLAHAFTLTNVDSIDIDVGIATHDMLFQDPLGSGIPPFLRFLANGYMVPRGGMAIPSGHIIPVPPNRNFSCHTQIEHTLDECWSGFAGEAEAVFPRSPKFDLDLLIARGCEKAKYLQVWTLDPTHRIWAFEPHDIVPAGLYLQGQRDLELIESANRPVTGIRLAPGQSYISTHWIRAVFEDRKGIYQH